MSHLFSPLRIGGLELPNRIVIAPMCQYSADSGSATDWHMIHLGSLSLSGAGLLTIEATSVSAEARITAGDLGLYNEDNAAALARVLGAIRAHSPIRVAIQLAHAGRKASCRVPWDGGTQVPPDAPGGWKTVAPSALPFNPNDDAPLALDRHAMRRIVDHFVAAAVNQGRTLGETYLHAQTAVGAIARAKRVPIRAGRLAAATAATN